jgi:hypothetical protein
MAQPLRTAGSKIIASLGLFAIAGSLCACGEPMDIITVNQLLLNDVILLIAWTLILFMLRNVIAPYVSEKGKNLATQEDIGKITDEIERVKLQYTSELEKIKMLYRSEIEIVKAELAKKSYIHSVQFEKEFQILSELWGQLIDLKHSLANTNIELAKYLFDDPQKKIDILLEFSGKSKPLTDLWERNRPFYPEEIYKALDKSIDLINLDFQQHYFPFCGSRADLTKEELIFEFSALAKKNHVELMNQLDDLCELIRTRIVPEEGINK